MFLTVMVIGLVGLVVMALPAFARHGGAAAGGHAAHHALHAGAPGHHPPVGATRFVPSPRLVFSLLALYGAFANAFVGALHSSALVAGLGAVLPAVAVERFAVTPLWNLLFRFQAAPSSPLEEMLLGEATAVTAFRNGRGIVSLVRDGRLVQFAARLVDAQAGLDVRVGDRLRVEDLDARRERLTVSVPHE